MPPKQKKKIVVLKFKDAHNIEKIMTIMKKTPASTTPSIKDKVRTQNPATANTISSKDLHTTNNSSMSSTPAPSRQPTVPSTSNISSGNSLITNAKGLPMNQATTGNGISSLDRSGKRVRHWTKQPRVVKSFTGYSMKFGSWMSKSQPSKKSTKASADDKEKRTDKIANGGSSAKQDGKAADVKKEVKVENTKREEPKALVSAN